MKEKFESTKVVIRNRKWKKDGQHNGQTKRNKRTNYATLDVMRYVGHNGIPVQECVQDVNGRFWTTETVADTHNDR
jgi:hypothetical protein